MSNPFGGGYQQSGGGGGRGFGGGSGGRGRGGGSNYAGGGGGGSNYSSGGGGGGSGYSGGGRGRSSRGGGRGYWNAGRYDSSRSSGRWNQTNAGRGGRGGGGRIQARFTPCSHWVRSGSCPNPNCTFAHVVQLHATVDATTYQPPENGAHQNQQVKAAVSDVSIWETAGQIKIFTGSYDGFWRLWNTSTNFSKEFECPVGRRVTKLRVANSFLFCGMEAAVPAADPETPVGMVHAWNLEQPAMPPLELQIAKPFLPYSHNQCVSALAIQDATVVTGSQDGSIRIWKFSSNEFILDKSLPGHARAVTGLVVVDQNLWSSSIDGSIRIWDTTNGECQYSIPKQPSPPANASQPQAPPSSPSNGHSAAVSCLISFQSPQHGTFILTGSLDGTIKAWSAATGECVASEDHAGQGVVSIAIADTSGGPQILLAGLESGRIVARNLMQTATTAALEALFVLDGRYNSAHNGAVKCVTPGPSATFYTGGNDGNLMVWQINGELGL